MRDGTDELRERVTDGDAMLREAGTTFLNGLEQLRDLRRVESFVAASCQVRSTQLFERWGLNNQGHWKH